jgi:uncharacterized membrane protein YccC
VGGVGGKPETPEELRERQRVQDALSDERYRLRVRRRIRLAIGGSIAVAVGGSLFAYQGLPPMTIAHLLASVAIGLLLARFQRGHLSAAIALGVANMMLAFIALGFFNPLAPFAPLGFICGGLVLGVALKHNEMD